MEFKHLHQSEAGRAQPRRETNVVRKLLRQDMAGSLRELESEQTAGLP
jgi:hypothetical protein